MCQQLSDGFSNVTFDASWDNFEGQVNSTDVDILGLSERKYRDLFDEHHAIIHQSLETKHSRRKSILDPTLTKRRQVAMSFKVH